VTGGAGFLGSWLSDCLVRSNAHLTSVDDLSTGVSGNIEHLLGSPNFQFEKLDVSSSNLPKREYKLIFHFASHVSPEEYQERPVETLLVNSQGTHSLLESARKNDATFIYASSSEIYGDAQIVPTPETYWGHVNPVGPRSCYDEGKRFGEAMCMAYHRTYGTDVRILRIFNTYGPRLRPDGVYGRAVSRFIMHALAGQDITVYGTGEQTRSFCYVTDTIEAVLLAASVSKISGETVNIGQPHEVKIRELARQIKTIACSRSLISYGPRLPDDPNRRRPDISKAGRLLKWFPRTSLDDGLRRTVTWFAERKDTFHEL